MWKLIPTGQFKRASRDIGTRMTITAGYQGGGCDQCPDAEIPEDDRLAVKEAIECRYAGEYEKNRTARQRSRPVFLTVYFD